MTSRIFPPVAIALLAFLLATNIYRARTQSITADEAFTYHQFLSGPASGMFNSYDANHHILHTFLCKVSLRLLGLSEFALRLPSLFGGLLYFAAVYRLCRYLFGGGWLFLLGVASLSLNPLLLDLLSAARGYGLALAFALWALYHLVLYFSARYDPAPPEHQTASLVKAAFGLALSVASNLTFLFTAAGLAVLAVIILLADGARSGDPGVLERHKSLAANCFYIPGMVTAFSIIGVPLMYAERGHFYIGTTSLAEASENLAAFSLSHHTTRWGIDSYNDALQTVVSIVARIVAPAVLLVAAVVCVQIVLAWIRAKSFSKLARTDQFLFLAVGATLSSVALNAAGHYALGMPYPIGRTGLHWVVFFLLISLGLAKRFETPKFPHAPVRAFLVAFLGLCATWFALRFNTSHYAEWRYDAGTRRIVKFLEQKHTGRQARVGVSPMLLHSVKFYRRLDRLEWMEVVDASRPESDVDYFVFISRDAQLVEKLRLRPLYNDPISGTVLAVPAQ